MTSGLRRLYLLSVLDALTTYAADGGDIHFASLNDDGKLAITFTLEDGEAYNELLSTRFSERFAAQEATSVGANGMSS